MNLRYHDLLPADFTDDSRVWVYQSNRLFTIAEALEIETALTQFVSGWQSHGQPVKGFATLFFGQFLIFMADQQEVEVSGCSTDSSVRFVKQLEQHYQVSLFDRQLLAFVVKEKIQTLPVNQLQYAIQNGFLEGGTLYFNNLVLNKKELIEKWIIPVKDSWLAQRVNLTTTLPA